MSAQFTSDFAAFSDFVTNHWSKEKGQLTLESGVVAFREYQEQHARCRAEIKPALTELDAGRGTDLDMEAVIQKGRAILASEGIVD